MSDQQQRALALRARLDELDASLVELLHERARLSTEVRGANVGSSVDVGEQRWLERLAEANPEGGMPPSSLRRILRAVRAEARSLEQPTRVGYLGAEGGFCHQAARSYFGAGSVYLSGDEGRALFDEVRRGRVDHVVFPFESNVDGLIQPNVTALAETDLVIVAQRELVTRYDVVSRDGPELAVRSLFATASVLTACALFVARELRGATIVDVGSPAAAVARALEEPASAAIVPAPTAAESGLEVVRVNVGDVGDMRTRFAVAGARPASRSGADTTCLLFSLNDAPGALYGVLRHFAEREVNLRRMQARPVAGEGFDYVFFVEVDGHVTDRGLVAALEAVKRSTRYFRILGSFPALS